MAASSVAKTRIFGVVIDELGFVVGSAGVVLVRSLRSGRVVTQTQVDAQGQFSFSGIDQGLYLAELINGAGTVVTTSPSFTLAIGQIVQLTPVIPQNSIGGLASLLGTSTAGAVNSAVSAGVMALERLAPITPDQ